MIQYYASHPQYILLLIVLIIITLIVWYKAGKASLKHSRENQKIMDKLKAENKLRNDYAILSDELIASSDAEELFRGVAINLQKRVADKDDMSKEYETLSEEQKIIYSFYTFLEDSESGISNFFRLNTEPLISEALKAVETLLSDEIVDIVRYEYKVFDDDDEEESFSQQKIEDADKKAAPSLSDSAVYKLAGEFIKNNSEKFIR